MLTGQTILRSGTTVDPSSLLRKAWRFNPTLTVFTIASAVLLFIGVIGMLLDPRIVLGMPNWAKSTKFGMSLMVYGATLLAILPLVTRRRLGQFVAHGTGAILTFEIVLLIFQAARGVPMHFNVATPFDAALWQAMGISIMLFWLITLIGVVLLLFQPMPNRVLAWSIRLGMLLTLIGLTQGFLMTTPNATQQAMLAVNQQVDLIGAHTVGALDGGPGLPLLGWSVEHGDLRIGHFVGIHSIQVLGLLGLLLTYLRVPWLTQRHQLALVVVGALGYLGLVGLVTWQALRDQPLFSPDSLTLAALGGLVAVVTAIAGATIFHGYSLRNTR